ncbi:unnamed protein product [Brassica oleracea]
MTTMLDLPDDLLDEIFSRVPLDSTTAVRSTCKAWNASFYRRMIVMMDHNVYLTSVVVNENASTKRLGKLTCLTHEQVKISEVFHCDGLLLFILKDDKRLVVWNPCLGETCGSKKDDMLTYVPSTSTLSGTRCVRRRGNLFVVTKS